MRRLTYENPRGEKVAFYLSPFLITSLTGIGEVDADLQGQKAPYQDGETYIDTILEPRYITLEGQITTKDLVEIRKYRREMSRICNPKLGLGLITLELDGDLKQIEGTLDSSPAFPERGRDPWQPFLITWKCPNPYWKSPTIQEEPMAAFVELFEFPSDYWEQGEDGDIYFEMGTEGHTRTFVNNGDGAVPIKIRIKGPTLNPTLTNLTTGELIKINRELSADDVLEISTEDGDKYILLNGENVFNWIDLSSTFWKLEVGENEIQYTADAGLESATLEITWQEQFVGV